ncbi:MAG: YceI family protein [Bacteroidota bacterium]
MSTVKWVIDPSHSAIGFKVKHMMFTNVSGKFQKFNSVILANSEDLENAGFKFDADIDSVTTGSSDRDKHLLSADFFDAQHYPKIEFTSSSFTKSNRDGYKLTGNLSLHGVTKEIVLDVEYGGQMQDPWGHIKSGFIITGKINRKDFNLNWNSTLEAGGVLVGEDVKLEIEVQYIKQ